MLKAIGIVLFAVGIVCGALGGFMSCGQMPLNPVCHIAPHPVLEYLASLALAFVGGALVIRSEG